MTPKTQSVCKHKHTEQRLSQGHAALHTSAEPKKQCGCVHGDSDPYCHDPLCPNYIAAYHVKSVALQPVSEDAPKVEEKKYLIALRWFKLFYNFFQEDIKGKPSAAMSAMSEDGELQELLREADRTR